MLSSAEGPGILSSRLSSASAGHLQLAMVALVVVARIATASGR